MVMNDEMERLRRRIERIQAGGSSEPPVFESEEDSLRLARRIESAQSSMPREEEDRPGVLARAGSAIAGAARGVAEDPIGAVKGIGQGIARSAGDLISAQIDPFGTTARVLAEEDYDGRRALGRAAESASLLIPGIGATTGRLAAAGLVGASAGAGALIDTDDPARGALLGGAGGALGGLASRGIRRRGTVDAPENLPEPTLGPEPMLGPEQNPRDMLRRTVESGDLEPARGPRRRTPEEQAEAIRRREIDDIVASERPDGIVSMARRQERSIRREVESRPPAQTAVDDADPFPVTGYNPDARLTRQTEVAPVYIDRSERFQGTIPGVQESTEPLRTYSSTSPRTRGIPQGMPKPKKNAVDEVLEPPTTPLDEAVDALAARTPRRKRRTPAAIPREGEAAVTPSQATPEPLAPSTVDLYDRVNPASEINAPRQVDATGFSDDAVVRPARVVEPEIVKPVRERRLQSAEELEVNFDQWYNDRQVNRESMVARVRRAIDEDVDGLLKAKGYQSHHSTRLSAMSEAKKIIGDNPELKIDMQKVQELVDRHPQNPGIPIKAMQRVVSERVKDEATAAQILRSADATPEMRARAQQVMDAAGEDIQEALRMITRETSAVARGLNAVKVTMNYSSDPAVYLVKAQRIAEKAGGTLSDDQITKISRLAREMGEICGI